MPTSALPYAQNGCRGTVKIFTAYMQNHVPPGVVCAVLPEPRTQHRTHPWKCLGSERHSPLLCNRPPASHEAPGPFRAYPGASALLTRSALVTGQLTRGLGTRHDRSCPWTPTAASLRFLAAGIRPRTTGRSEGNCQRPLRSDGCVQQACLLVHQSRSAGSLHSVRALGYHTARGSLSHATQHHGVYP